MNVVKCTNGHFFDGDSYHVCPHCGAPSDSMQQPPQEVKEKKKGFFGRKKETSATPQASSQRGTVGYFSNEAPSNPGTGESGNRNAAGDQVYGGQSYTDKKKKDVTLDFWQTGSISKPISEEETIAASDMPSDRRAYDPSAMSLDNRGYVPSSELSDDRAVNPSYTPANDRPHEAAGEDINRENQTSGGSLLSKVRSASASSEGKTMSYFSAVTNNNYSSGNKGGAGSTGSDGNVQYDNGAGEARPAGQIQNQQIHTDPVVGWLVCIKGEHFGESFNIGAGMNSIGRNDSNRIVLYRDMTVSREKHALITYEPKHRQFYVKPGESSGLTYINDEYITETKRISPKDIIELGNSKFMFIPLCGEDFTWEDYMKG